jgi:hypothetical protein
LAVDGDSADNNWIGEEVDGEVSFESCGLFPEHGFGFENCSSSGMELLRESFAASIVDGDLCDERGDVESVGAFFEVWVSLSEYNLGFDWRSCSGTALVKRYISLYVLTSLVILLTVVT